jgi:hypothetical protein
VDRLTQGGGSRAFKGWLHCFNDSDRTRRPVVPIGTPSPRATAFWTGDLALREVAGISELPEESVNFGGTLVGVRNLRDIKGRRHPTAFAARR